MKQAFTARVFQEGNWFVAQCLEIDVASQGETQDEALSNLREALELHFEPPNATIIPELQKVEVEINAA
ncbi:MAG: type II toxin-antitoxin system HicB family antitoxin [Pleurocapsa sp.]